MDNKKYCITDISQDFHDKKVYRIKALKDFGTVKKGDLGGFVESENNLSHDGLCWLFDEAIAADNSRVVDDAVLYNNVIACDNCFICGKVLVYDDSMIKENAILDGEGAIFDNSLISGNTRLEYTYNLKNANIVNNNQILSIYNIGKYKKVLTFYRDIDEDIRVDYEYTNVPINIFVEDIQNQYKGTYYELQYMAAVKLAKLSILF